MLTIVIWPRTTPDLLVASEQGLHEGLNPVPKHWAVPEALHLAARPRRSHLRTAKRRSHLQLEVSLIHRDPWLCRLRGEIRCAQDFVPRNDLGPHLEARAVHEAAQIQAPGPSGSTGREEKSHVYGACDCDVVL
jgi:hypothetical protein